MKPIEQKMKPIGFEMKHNGVANLDAGVKMKPNE